MSVDTNTRPEHSLKIPTDRGDSIVTWTPGDDQAVAEAAEAFRNALGQGMAAFAVDVADPTKGGNIKEFDPSAEHIDMVKPLQGG